VQALELAEDPDHGATGGIDYPLKVREKGGRLRVGAMCVLN